MVKEIKPKVNEYAVKALEDMLAKAKCGEVVGVVIVAQAPAPEAKVTSNVSGVWAGRGWKVIGALEEVKYDLIAGFAELEGEG